jgi:osmotically-inducible protein OsmY
MRIHSLNLSSAGLRVLLSGWILASLCGTAVAGVDQDQRVHDAWLDGKLETALLFNPHLNSFEIDTDVENGIATLRGAVEDDVDRDLAAEIARSIEGVREVRNELLVDSEAASKARNSDQYKEKSDFARTLDNATLTAGIKSELIVNEHTDAIDINVDSNDGVVTLTGEVDSEEAADLAEQIAANDPKTREVNNRLRVRADR